MSETGNGFPCEAWILLMLAGLLAGCSAQRQVVLRVEGEPHTPPKLLLEVRFTEGS